MFFQETNGRGLSHAKSRTMWREEILSAIFVLRFLRVEPRTYCFLSATHSSAIIKLKLGEDRSIGCPVDIGSLPAVITKLAYSGVHTCFECLSDSSP